MVTCDRGNVSSVGKMLCESPLVSLISFTGSSSVGKVCYSQFPYRVIQGSVVQSIVSLTSSLRGQLVKCFMTQLPNVLISFVEKIREAFALQKLLTFFSIKNVSIFQVLMFEILTKC